MSNFFIPKPCHENWNQMTPQEQGRHCAVCSKVVVDFTQKTPPEINDIMSNATGKVCGNFNVEQLNRDAQMKVFKNPLNIFGRNWKYFAMSVFGFFALQKKTEAQVRGKVAIRGDVAPVEYHDSNKKITALYGTVTQHDGKPVGGAVVKIMSAGNEIARVTTNANGTYSAKLQPGTIASKKIDIEVTDQHMGYKYIRDLNISQERTKLNIALDEMIMLKGEVEYIELPKVIEPVKVEPVPVKDSAQIIPVCRFKDSEPEDKSGKLETKEHKTITMTDVVLVKDITGPENQTKTAIEHTADNTIDLNAVIPSIYPNPAGTNATIYCNKQAAYKVELYDEKGALKMSKAFFGDRTDMDVSALARGHYFVKLRDDEGHANTLKLIKQ